MSSPHIPPRRVVLPMLLLLSGCVLLALISLLLGGGRPGDLRLVLPIGALIWVATILYLRGYEPARHIALVGITASIAILLPEPFLVETFSISVFVPPALALVLSSPIWVGGSFVAVYLSVLARAGWQGIYLEPVGLTITTIIVGSMVLSRVLTDLARAATEEQAQLLAGERAQLAQRVEQRTHELRAANAELVRAGQLKDAFLANVSHELRTPLNVILGNVGLLQEEVYGAISERQRRALTTVAESGQQLLNLINDLLDLARMKAGDLAFAYTTVDVREVCESCLSLMQQPAERKNLSLTLVIDPAVTTLRSDPRRLRQILLNLLSNAVKFTPAGRAIGLEVGLGAGWIEFVVWDEGVGIAAEHLEWLFQPFTQADEGLARQYEGAGLGLALVRQLVSLHNGQVDVVSGPGQGSRFSVRLPV